MGFERALDIQRLRLLRIIAGLVLLLGFLSVGPVSRGFSVWACGFVGSVLARAEAAARYLVIAHAYRLAARGGFDVDRKQLAACAARVSIADADVSLADCQRRLRVLRMVLKDLPRAALRLLRQIVKQARRTGAERAFLPAPEVRLLGSPCDWRLARTRIDRPPDRVVTTLADTSTSPRKPGGRRWRLARG